MSRRVGRIRLSVAPMMGWTDRHYRYLARLVTRDTLLYTEMVTAPAVLHGDRNRLLGFDPAEHPVALQLGGEDPAELAACARVAQELGYDEVNLNVGCPSDRVQQGRFGACLMADPDRVAACVDAMRGAVDIPVTVKHRIGIDDADAYEDMERFVRIVAAAGVDACIVHARKAWLQGLSPKENRTVPPLRHAEVHRLKRAHPELVIETNGGIAGLADVQRHLEHVDGVMLGRAAYEDVWLLAGADAAIHGGSRTPPSRREVVGAMLPYVERVVSEGEPISRVTRHMVNLFRGVPGARSWRRHLSEHAHRPGAGPEVVADALALLPDAVLDDRPMKDAVPQRTGQQHANQRSASQESPKQHPTMQPAG